LHIRYDRKILELNFIIKNATVAPQIKISGATFKVLTVYPSVKKETPYFYIYSLFQIIIYKIIRLAIKKYKKNRYGTNIEINIYQEI